MLTFFPQSADIIASAPVHGINVDWMVATGTVQNMNCRSLNMRLAKK